MVPHSPVSRTPEDLAPHALATERRRFIRVALPSEVTLDGIAHPVRDLSLGGIGLVRGVPRRVEGGLALVTIRHPGFRFEFSVHVRRVLHGNPLRATGLEFLDLTPEQSCVLAGIIASTLSDGCPEEDQSGLLPLAI